MRSTLLTMLLCWSVPGSAGADDTAALTACERGVEKCELTRDHCLGDLSKALASRSEERLEAEELAQRLALAVRERDRAEEGARTRASWALGLGGAGVAVVAGGVALVASGRSGGFWAVGGGALAVVAGVAVARF